MRVKHKTTLAAAVLFATAAAYFFLDPSTGRFFPKCVFHVATGLKCPGCGSQRALHALLHGDIATAFRMNIWLPFAVAYIAFVAGAMFFRKSGSRFAGIATDRYLFMGFLVLTAAWWVVRNLLGF